MKSKYITSIDLLRAISFLLVFLFHAELYDFGYIGVDIFFIISGFVIYLNYHDKNVRPLDFLKKRIIRLIPAFSVLIISLLIYFIIFLEGDLYYNFLQSFIASIFYSNNWLLIIKNNDYWGVSSLFDPLIHTWSLGIEEQFYIVFPFLLLIFNRVKKSLFFFITLFLILHFLIDDYYNTFGRIWLFFLGFIIVKFRLTNVRINKILQYTSPFLFLISLYFQFYYFTIFSSIILISTLYNNDFKIPKLFTILGKISYGSYLWHLPLLVAFRLWFGELGMSHILICLFFAYLISYFSFNFIELPIVKLKNKDKVFKNLILLNILMILTSTSLYFNLFGTNKNDFIDYNMRITKTITPSKQIVVYGDSNARDFINVLIEYGISVNDIDYIDYKDVEILNNLTPKENIFVVVENISLLDNIKKSLKYTYVLDKSFPLTISKYRYNKLFRTSSSVKLMTDFPLIDESVEHDLAFKLKIKTIDPFNILRMNNGKMIYVTDKLELISEDGIHLTKNGARYIAEKNKVLFDKVF